MPKTKSADPERQHLLLRSSAQPSSLKIAQSPDYGSRSSAAASAPVQVQSFAHLSGKHHQLDETRRNATQNKMLGWIGGAALCGRTLCGRSSSCGAGLWLGCGCLALPVEAKSGNCNCARKGAERGIARAFCHCFAGWQAGLMFYLKSSTLYYNGRCGCGCDDLSICLMEWSI